MRDRRRLREREKKRVGDEGEKDGERRMLEEIWQVRRERERKRRGLWRERHKDSNNCEE